jgi:hypothetical protein
MQFDPSKRTPPSASTSLKRSLAQHTTAGSRKAPRVVGTEGVAGRSSSSVFSPEFEMPSSSSSQLNSNSWTKGGSSGQRTTRAAPPAFKGAKNKARVKGFRATVLDGPLHDRNHIVTQYDREYSVPPLKSDRAENPKSVLANWHSALYGTAPNYEFAPGSLNGQKIFRYVF